MASLASALDGLARQLADVRSHQLPALAAAHSAEALRRAEADVRAELARADAQAKELVLELPDAAGSAEQQRDWTQRVQTLAKDVEALRGEFRSALLAGRRAVASEGATAARRELGLDSGSSTSAVKGDDKLATASADVTTALQRTVASMSAELEKSSYSSALLDESSAAMQGISREYTSFGDMLRNSGTLIRSMERADLIDAAILAAAALFFVLCIAYILKVRVWDRGVGIVSFFWRFVAVGRSQGDVKEKYQLAEKAASAAKASAKESSLSASKSMAAAAAATAKDAASSASASLAASKSMAAAAAATAKDAASSATASLASASESASRSLARVAEAATPAVTRVTDVLKAAASTAAYVAAAFDMGGEDAEEIAEAQEDLSGGMAEGTWGVITDDDDEEKEGEEKEKELQKSAKHIEL